MNVIGTSRGGIRAWTFIDCGGYLLGFQNPADDPHIYRMVRFAEWFYLQERQVVEPEVLQSWERAFQDGLEQLIARTHDPVLRTEFDRMRSCPVRDQQGRCHSFTDYILSAIVRNGLHYTCDPEEILSYVYQCMMNPTTMAGQPRSTLFGGFDETRPYLPGQNPLQARFLTSVANAIRSIAGGKVAYLKNVRRKPGTLSIAGGRTNEPGLISPDQIPSMSASADEEMFRDITALLQRQQQFYPRLPLVDLFHSILSNEGTRAQRAKFGHTAANEGRRIIIQTIAQYARSTENWRCCNCWTSSRISMLPSPRVSGESRRPSRNPNSRRTKRITKVS